ncbi:MAG: DinB family protein, partial [Cryomorphaceae bacterium]
AFTPFPQNPHLCKNTPPMPQPQSPSADEYAPYYANYVRHAAGRSLSEALQCDVSAMDALFDRLTEADGNYAYAPDKWTVKEVLLHCIDAERIFAYRALRLLRGDNTPLPGYDQDPYVPASDANARSLTSIREEWQSVRAATLSLYAHAPETHLGLIGTASDCPISARALAYIIPGHYLHHVEVLRERYGLR